MPSFDVVNELDMQEVDNAVNQAVKEIESRFDFRGAGASLVFDRKASTIEMKANNDQKVENIFEVLQSKAHRRGIDIIAFEKGKIEAMGGQTQRLIVKLKSGIEKE